MEILNGKEVGLAIFQPLLARQGLALRAVPVAATVVGDALVAADVTLFDVSAEAEADWIRQIVDTYVDASTVMSACTPSRINNEGDPGGIRARDTNFGRGFGDYFAYRELLRGWLAAGNLEGLELT